MLWLCKKKTQRPGGRYWPLKPNRGIFRCLNYNKSPLRNVLIALMWYVYANVASLWRL